MTVPWMLHGAVIGACVLITALALEQLLRLARRPTRWVWLVALLIAVVLIGSMPLRPRPVAATAPSTSSAVVVDPLAQNRGGSGAPPSTELMTAVRAVQQRVVATLLGISEWQAPRGVDVAIAMVWGFASIALLITFAVVQRRFHRARERWPLVELHGVLARVAPDVGPAVIGLRPPEIVIPQWLLRRDAEEQQLVLSHEREHLDAGDPFLLGAAWIGVALLPWNPALWYMATRLRLAVEIDCDTRILRRGVGPRVYGSLLIDLAAHCSGLTAGAPAFAERPTQLEQRLLALRARPSRFAVARGTLCVATAFLATGAAASVRMPATAATPASPPASPELLATTQSVATDTEAPDTTQPAIRPSRDAAKLQLAKVRLLDEVARVQAQDPAQPVLWYVDDVAVPADSGRAAASRLPRSIRIETSTAGAPTEIRIYSVVPPAMPGIAARFGAIMRPLSDSAAARLEKQMVMEQRFTLVTPRPSEPADSMAAVIKAKVSQMSDSTGRAAGALEMLKRLDEVAGARGSAVAVVRLRPDSLATSDLRDSVFLFRASSDRNADNVGAVGADSTFRVELRRTP